MAVKIENIMKTNFGESNNVIKADYKKTVLIKQYETEVIESETSLTIDRDITGAERMLISAVLQAQLEYQVYCNLVYEHKITNDELRRRREDLENGITAIKEKAEKILGRNLDEIVANS